MNSTLKSLLFWIGLVVIGALIWQFSNNLQKAEKLVSFTEFMDLVDSQKIPKSPSPATKSRPNRP